MVGELHHKWFLFQYPLNEWLIVLKTTKYMHILRTDYDTYTYVHVIQELKYNISTKETLWLTPLSWFNFIDSETSLVLGNSSVTSWPC